jgi:hypothetical protein
MSRGSALPTALFALAFIGALIVGVTFGTRQATAVALLAERSAGLEPAAEQSLVTALAAWDSLARSNQVIGSVQTLAVVSQPGTTSSVWVTRLSQRVFWVVGQATNAGPPLLRRRLGVLVRASGTRPALVPGRAWGELP